MAQSQLESSSTFYRQITMWRSINAKKLLVWLLLSLVFAANTWLLSQAFRYFEHIITVVSISAIFAFLLNYPVRALDRTGISRGQAVGVVLIATLVVLIILGGTVLPIVIEQIVGLSKQVPEWVQSSSQNINSLEGFAKSKGLNLDFEVIRNQINSNLPKQLEGFTQQAVAVALGTASSLLDSLLIVVLSVYILIDGDKLWEGAIGLFPNKWGRLIGESLRLNFQRFFISQFLLGAFMAVTLTIIFLLLDVPFALSFAILIGFSQLIPFVGATLGIGLVTLLVMLHNFSMAVWVFVASFLLQQIKDNFLTPKLMGNFIGLDPVMILLAVLVGLQIAGLLGVLVAVPIAGTIKSMIDLIRNPHPPDLRPAESGSDS
jgi:predicted PurR-regulated permease PerM